MLDKAIMLPFTMFLVFLFAFFAVTGMGVFNHWALVQNQAQFLASSVGKWGGYTTEAAQSVNKFARDLRLSPGDVRVTVNEPGPISYGKPVWVTVTIPYYFKVGRFNAGTFTLSGTGRTVSTYAFDAYSVSYTSP